MQRQWQGPCNIQVLLPSVNGSDRLPDTAQPGKDKKRRRKELAKTNSKGIYKKSGGYLSQLKEAFNIEFLT